MVLRSKLFSGDRLLEAAAVDDASHIAPGARGDHVGKIQQALIVLDEARIDKDASYGPATAAAVLAYKKKRGIINFSYQTQPDDIVGKMTIASLDREMVLRENVPKDPLIVRPVNPGPSPVALDHPALRAPPAPTNVSALVGDSPGRSTTTALDLNNPAFQKIRVPPRFTSTVDIINGDGARITGRNILIESDLTAKISWAFDPDDKQALPFVRLNPEPVGPSLPEADGGSVHVRQDKFELKIDSYKPGDAAVTIRAENGDSLLHVEVRAPKWTGPTAPAPVKVHPQSKAGLISGDGDPGVPGGVSGGRPMKAVGSRRKINIAGERESPDFEDYQSSLGRSDCPDFPDRNQRRFRPWTEDPDPSVSIANSDASDICIRNTPMTDEIIKVIRRIKASPCRLTYSNHQPHVDKLKSEFASEGKIVDEVPDQAVVIDFP